MTEAVVTGSVEMLDRTATKERKGDATASPNLTASDATAEPPVFDGGTYALARVESFTGELPVALIPWHVLLSAFIRLE
jgi:hypothetical protein